MKLELIFLAGKGKRQPTKLLFVHVICVGAWIWQQHFFPYFSDAGFDCYAVSLRGHAGSEGYDQIRQWTLTDYTDDLHATVAKIDGPLIFIGHSLGGAIVQNWIRTGGKGKAAALLTSVPPWGLALSAWRMSLLSPQLFWELAKLNVLGMNATNADIMRQGLFSESVTADEFRGFMEKAGDESPFIGLELQGAWWFAPMPCLAPPMLVMGAANDKFIPLDEIWRTAVYYGVQPKIIPHLSHSVMADTHWQEAAKALHDWLICI